MDTMSYRKLMLMVDLISKVVSISAYGGMVMVLGILEKILMIMMQVSHLGMDITDIQMHFVHISFPREIGGFGMAMSFIKQEMILA